MRLFREAGAGREARFPVLWWLVDAANGELKCWASIDDIATETGYGRARVIEAIDWLKSKGAILVTREKGIASNYYRVTGIMKVGEVVLEYLFLKDSQREKLLMELAEIGAEEVLAIWSSNFEPHSQPLSDLTPSHSPNTERGESGVRKADSESTENGNDNERKAYFESTVNEDDSTENAKRGTENESLPLYKGTLTDSFKETPTEQEEDGGGVDLEFVKVRKAYEENFRGGIITQMIAEDIQEQIKLHGADRVIEAMKVTLGAGKSTWNYTLGILHNWEKEGYPSPGSETPPPSKKNASRRHDPLAVPVIAEVMKRDDTARQYDDYHRSAIEKMTAPKMFVDRILEWMVEHKTNTITVYSLQIAWQQFAEVQHV